MTTMTIPDWLPGACIASLPILLVLAACCAAYKPPDKPPRPQLPSEVSDIARFFGAGTFKQQLDTRMRYWAAKGTMSVLPGLMLVLLIILLLLVGIGITYLVTVHPWTT